MLRPWLLQGVEPVIVLVPRKTDIIWVWGVFFGLWGLDGSPKTARIQPSVSMSRVSPHSCVVKTARCVSGTCVVEPTLWKGQSSTVQYSVVWQFRLRIVHFSYRSFLICLIATIWFALNLTHLYTYHFDGFQVGGVGRCRGSHENVNSGRPPRSASTPSSLDSLRLFCSPWLQPQRTPEVRLNRHSRALWRLRVQPSPGVGGGSGCEGGGAEAGLRAQE